MTFSEWTRDGHLRHPSFQGLREDKAAGEVTRERAIPLNTATPQPAANKSGRKPPPSARRSRTKSSSPRQKKPLSGEYDPPIAVPDAVRLTHPDKVLYPEDGITKAQLAGYYAHVADWILPHIVDRPLTLVRCPQGHHQHCFFQKHAGKGMPDVLGHVSIVEKNTTIDYALVKDLAGLLSLVQMNTLEIHVWGARADNVEKPDRLVFDLDPAPDLPWKRVIESARQLRTFFEELDLASFVKTTGGKGLHLVLPIERRTGWDEAREICHAIATAVCRADPDRYTTNMSKSARGGKIFIDYLRNSRGATAIAPYSTRARAGCPVATPMAWDELSSLASAQQYTLANVYNRLTSLKRDPWRDLASTRQTLSKSLLKKLRGGS